MKSWSTRLLIHSGKEAEETRSIQINRGIFQGDSLSPLLFCISLIPLSRQLSQADFGYKLHGDERPVSHLFYMDNLNVFAKNEAIFSLLLSVVSDFSNAICMKFGLDKCAKINLKETN